jgi:lysozyme family protein
VKSVQQQHSLQVDGKCGEHTVAAIEQALGG